MNRKPIFLLIVALLACFALPAGWAAADPVEPSAVDAASFIPGEPNDTFATATPFTFNTFAYNDNNYFLTPSDVDYFRINLEAPTNAIWAQAYPYSGWGATVLEVELAIYDSAQTLLAQDASCDDEASVEATLPMGVAYLRVKPCTGKFDLDWGYRLDVYAGAFEREPNNTFAAANVIQLNGISGAIAPGGDVDTFYFTAAAGQYLNVEALYQNYDSFPLLTLHSADGIMLAQASAGCIGPDYACLAYITPTAGTYYLKLTPPTGGVEYYSIDFNVREVVGPEPNDTPAQAVLIGYGAMVGGHVSSSDLYDYYRFAAQAGDAIALGNPGTDWLGEVDLTLYDPAMNPVSLNSAVEFPEVYWSALPVGGQYTLKVSYPGPPSGELWYDLELTLLTGDEPENNVMATATPVVVGQVISSRHDYTCDQDWYRFQGRAGDVFPIENPDLSYDPFWQLYDAAGNLLADTAVLPFDGTYYLKVRGDLHYIEDGASWWDCKGRGPYKATVGSALWVSADFNGLGGGTTITQQDIATRDTAAGKWKLVFDASDVGITKDVTAFEVMPNGSILMSLDAGQNVTGLGWVAPQDIIRFVPTTLGAATAGTFQWYLDGSDVGLTTADEKIDAIYMQPTQWWPDPLRISTFGPGSVPRQSGGNLNFADEDLINFVGTQYGATSAGKWRMNLDGSTIPGMGAEDLNAVARVELDYTASPSLYVMRDAYAINGVKGGSMDVLSDLPTWRLVIKGFTNKAIDGLAVGPAWMP
jgi:hypothetical protein